MTFYFKPPRGEIPLHRLQECLEERIDYLHFVNKSDDISDCPKPFKFEYLTDGTALDRTGHFMLRLVALRLNVLKEFLIESESVLYQKRLKCLTFSEIRGELRIALRHVNEILLSSFMHSKYRKFLQNFSNVCQGMISSQATEHAFAKNHPHECSKHHLLATRQIELRGGKAIVPCAKWCQLLSCLYVEHLKYGLEQLATSNTFENIRDDDRLQFLFGVVKARLKSYHSTDLHDLKPMLATDVDEKSCFFPPCMKNLHYTLRHRHRLSHYSRFYYSLFLKDAGMPLMESMEFWSQEYAQSNFNHSSCSHTWQKDNKRYIYSIRHMYGLEGARREYSSPSCQQMQKMCLTPLSEGGCPFVNFDEEKLLKCLHDKVKLDSSLKSSLIQVNIAKGASAACKLYCRALHDHIRGHKCHKNSEVLSDNASLGVKSFHVLSPSQFYFHVSGLLQK